jgi:hypothetical protein
MSCCTSLCAWFHRKKQEETPASPPPAESSESPTPPKDAQPEEFKPREPEELWNLAYDSLRGKDAEAGDLKLTKAYETVLFRIGDKPTQTLPEKITQIAEVGGMAREKELRKAVEDGQERTRRFQDATERTVEVLDVVRGANELIGKALSAFPQAAAAWTGVMLVFEVRRIQDWPA